MFNKIKAHHSYKVKNSSEVESVVEKSSDTDSLSWNWLWSKAISFAFLRFRNHFL